MKPKRLRTEIDIIPTSKRRLEVCPEPIKPPGPSVAAAPTVTVGVMTNPSPHLKDLTVVFAQQLARLQVTTPWGVYGGLTKQYRAAGIQDEEVEDTE